MKVAIYTLGCKVNQYESNGIIQKFIDNGFEVVDFNEKADVYIINTCTVTNMSDRKSRQILRRAKELNPLALIVAVGCYVQVARNEVEQMPEIDICIGTNEKSKIFEIVKEKLAGNNVNITYNQIAKLPCEKINDLKENYSKMVDYDEFGTVTYTEKTRAIIKVQDGCDNFCSYCIIPYARGKIRSRDPKKVLEEITLIANKGYKEVVLTGIHIASYGRDFEKDYKLIDLIEDVNNISGIERIRLGSIEPLWVTDEVIERLSKIEKLCHQFHLSLQSGCDETLKRMNRKYSIKEFKTIAHNLRNTFDDCILTTDIIVGFPGETEEEFNTTYKFLKEIKFYKTHIFKYSKRKGTVAETLPNQVSPKVQEERSKLLIELSDKNEKEYLQSYIGKTVKVLFEEQEDDFYKGHTSNYLMVKTKSDKNITNQIINVIIIDRDNLELIAKL